MSESGLATLGPIGWIGLGNMGRPMALRLNLAGVVVVAFDIDEDIRRSVAGQGITPGESPQAIGNSCETVIVMLPNSDVVDNVVHQLSDCSTVGRLRTVVDMGSSEPMRTRALAEHLAARGITMVDAPVSGGVRGAESGQLAIMAGGRVDALEILAPIFDVLGNKIIRVGDVGAGHAVKSLNNLMSASHLLASIEALLIAARFGLDPSTVLAAVNSSSGQSGSTATKIPQFIMPRTFDSGFTAGLMEKDIRVAVNLAQSMGLSAPLAETILDHWQRLNSALDPGSDHTAIGLPMEARLEATLSAAISSNSPRRPGESG